MAAQASFPSDKFGKAKFQVDQSDLLAARELGILREDVQVHFEDPERPDFGFAYDRQANLADEEFSSQKAVRAACKEFAIECGFQIFVKQSSVKPNNSGNAKYQCKKLNGVQFFDTDLPTDKAQCPFYINVYGSEGKWKITKVNFAHNHKKNVGFSHVPCVEGSLSRPARAQRNTTQEVERLTLLVMKEMLPLHNRSIATLTGKAIKNFLVSRGFHLGKSTISRMRQDIDDRLHGDLVESYQKLSSYLELVFDKNPGSVWRLDRTSDDSTFERAMFIPNVGIHIVKMSKPIVGFDAAHLKGEMYKRGVFLVATTKDYNNHVIPFAFALVPVETFDHWFWFMECVKSATGIDRFTALSDRQKGLLAAVAQVFPQAGHRFCLRHLMDNAQRSGAKLTIEDRRLICQLARSDCENDYKLYFSELSASNRKAADYTSGVDQNHWVKYKYREAFGLPTFDEITSNLSEQANNWLGTDLRSAKPLDAFNMFFMKLSELTSERRQTAANWARSRGDTELVPVLHKQLKYRTVATNMCTYTPLMEGAYSVQHLGPQSRHGYVHTWRLVNLPASECTCGGWQDESFPCIHAVCAAIQDGRRVEDLYDGKRMSIDHFRETYTFAFCPWPIDVTLATDATLRIPELEVTPARMGKRGFKPGPKPKHKRKQAKNAL
ncbi:hypothetical protein PR001_g28134 [Phytophthora rubi]|uniref:SWIM-type domain-containing protein n=1 Tax=Phytophthora rubi TaxID=129364 RepID=A0A6A3HDT9_9STRA|nr:hypothetical protein PR001_g28134 [Phytophthora rubi]